MISYALVFIQLGSIALIGGTGPWLADAWPLLTMQGVATILGLWSVWSMRVGNFNITPDPATDSQIVTTGPYRLIRHPMYSALLLGTLAMVLNAFTLMRLGYWLILLAILIVKLSYEEKLLLAVHDHYAQYVTTTQRLIPYLY